MSLTPTWVRAANLGDARDSAAVVMLLDAYAADPRGGGVPLTADVRARLAVDLRKVPSARAWLAFDGEQPVGVCVGFFGYSTFRARPLLNLHDVAVLAAHRGRGVGHALLEAAEAHAREHGCCKLTLEVQDDNTPARKLYERFGFRDVVYGNSQATRFLNKLLDD